MTTPRRASIATKFEAKLAAEARAKEDEARIRKLADEKRRRDEVRDPPGLALPADATHGTASEYPEVFYRPAPKAKERARREYEYDEKEVVSSRPEPLDFGMYPGVTRMPEPSNVMSPAAVEMQGGGERSSIDSSVIGRLQADLERERNHVRRLAQDLQQTRHQVVVLRGEQGEAKRLLLQAVLAEAKADAARLRGQLADLKRLLEDSWEQEGRLVREIDGGRSRELELNRQLEDARRETRRLEREAEVEMRIATSTDKEKRIPGKGREEKVSRRLSNQKSDTMTVKKTTVNYEIIVPKKSRVNRNNGCHIM
ncbi:hypothetical protein MMC16_005876 [Acarospora aff. strigata]|nr:hypothetical protein [Acarospora aff. strigata]